jgi:hypothetical protein
VIGEDPDPSSSMDGTFSLFPTTELLDRTRLGRRLRAASTLSAAARNEAYAALKPTSPHAAAPFATYISGLRTDFFSARMGCQVEHPSLRHRPRGAVGTRLEPIGRKQRSDCHTDRRPHPEQPTAFARRRGDDTSVGAAAVRLAYFRRGRTLQVRTTTANHHCI